jgi:hypothetical protein
VLSYEPFRPACLNLYGEVILENNEKIWIQSDSSWWVTDDTNIASEQCTFNPKSWKNAQIRDTDWFITHPDFDKGILSTIEKK